MVEMRDGVGKRTREDDAVSKLGVGIGSVALTCLGPSFLGANRTLNPDNPTLQLPRVAKIRFRVWPRPLSS